MPDIRHLVFIRSSPEKIYSAISTQQGIASWWSEHNNATPLAGTEYRISFGSDYYKRIKIGELIPYSRIVWNIVEATPEWLNTSITFDIRPAKDGTGLRFSHSAWKEYSDMFSQCSYHWAIFLANLKIFTEKGQKFALKDFF